MKKYIYNKIYDKKKLVDYKNNERVIFINDNKRIVKELIIFIKNNSRNKLTRDGI